MARRSETAVPSTNFQLLNDFLYILIYTDGRIEPFALPEQEDVQKIPYEVTLSAALQSPPHRPPLQETNKINDFNYGYDFPIPSLYHPLLCHWWCLESCAILCFCPHPQSSVCPLTRQPFSCIDKLTSLQEVFPRFCSGCESLWMENWLVHISWDKLVSPLPSSLLWSLNSSCRLINLPGDSGQGINKKWHTRNVPCGFIIIIYREFRVSIPYRLIPNPYRGSITVGQGII